MGDTTDDLIDLAEQVSPKPAAARARHAPHRRRAHLDGRAGDGDPRPRRRGPLVHRVAGRPHHRLGARQGADHRRHAGPHPAARSTTARSRSSPASRASPRTPRTSPPSAAAARTPPRSRSPRRSTPTSARSTPTSTASSPPTRASCPTARQVAAHHLRGDARARGQRRQGAAPALRRVRAPLRPPDPRALVVLAQGRARSWSPTRPHPKGKQWSSRSSPESRTTSATPRSPSSASPTVRARPPRSSAPSPTPRSTST